MTRRRRVNSPHRPRGTATLRRSGCADVVGVRLDARTTICGPIRPPIPMFTRRELSPRNRLRTGVDGPHVLAMRPNLFTSASRRERDEVGVLGGSQRHV